MYAHATTLLFTHYKTKTTFYQFCLQFILGCFNMTPCYTVYLKQICTF